MLALLDGGSQDALEEIADEPLPGSVVVLACRIPALATHAALALGRRALGSAAARTDLVHFAPSAEKWTVDEIAAVTARMAVMPAQRHFLVIDRADAIEQRAYDRLLRVIEEPVAPMTVVLVTPSVDSLPDTILGRASTALTIFPADQDTQIAALVDAGASHSAAREAVQIAGSHAHLALPLALSNQLRPLAKALTAPRIDAGTPVSDMLTRLRLASTIADALEKEAASPTGRRYDELTPTGKLAARGLLRLFVEHRRTSLVAALPAVDASGLEAVAACLAALDQFERRLAASVGPALALAALASESPHVRIR